MTFKTKIEGIVFKDKEDFLIFLENYKFQQWIYNKFFDKGYKIIGEYNYVGFSTKK